MGLQDLNNYGGSESGKPMPSLFIGHGSPMNGIQDNEFSQYWIRLGEEIPKPEAVLCISAHWLTKGTYVTAMPAPRTIHDFSGFPDELYYVQYPAPGSPDLAIEAKALINTSPIGLDYDWGLDHGTWSVVRHMYPHANIPVIQLSIDYSKNMQYHYDLAKELYSLRAKKVLIIGSGNMVHNLRMLAWDKINEVGYGYDWALEMNSLLQKDILAGNHKSLINYMGYGKAAELSIPTPDHYLPLLYILALQNKADALSFFNEKAIAGSLTMTSLKIG